MAWGIQKWGGAKWGAGSATNNLSFEIAGSAQGTADKWAVATSARGQGVCCFSAEESPYLFGLVKGPTSWSDAEMFAYRWKTFPVHIGQDKANKISLPGPYDLATAIAVINELCTKWIQHLYTTAYVHLTADLTNLFYTTPPQNAVQAAAVLRAFVPYFNRHLMVCGDTVHMRGDTVNLINTLLPEPLDLLPLLVGITAELRVKFNKHLLTESFGVKTTSDCKFVFTSSDISVGLFVSLPYESFERGWAVPDLFPLHADQRIQYAFDTYADDPSWPGGHEFFKSDWLSVDHEYMPTDAESYERDYVLPGTTNPSYTNNIFRGRYFDSVLQLWRFIESGFQAQIEFGITEPFEAGWQNNDTFYTKYYFPSTMWKFKEDIEPTARQLTSAYFGSYTFAQCDILAGTSVLSAALAVGEYSTVFQVRVTEVIAVAGSGIGTLAIEYRKLDGSLRIIYAHVYNGAAVGTIIDSFSDSDDPSSTHHSFMDMCGSIRQVVSIVYTSGGESDGYVVLEGAKRFRETFEDDWVLTYS